MSAIPTAAGKLLIKQVIGRTILDTAALGCPFEIGGDEGAWTITVRNVPAGVSFDIRRHLDDLNVFHFDANPASGLPLQKYWLYGKQPPRFKEDAAAGSLTMTFDMKVPYTNEVR